MSELADFGLIGLAVMGENLALNVESRGYKMAVFNRTTEKVDNLTMAVPEPFVEKMYRIPSISGGEVVASLPTFTLRDASDPHVS